MIELVAGAFWLLDMGSTNGPQIGGKRVGRHQLANGDVFCIGDTRIRYEEGTPADAALDGSLGVRIECERDSDGKIEGGSE